MSLQPLIPMLATLLAASVAAMTWAARTGQAAVSFAAAAIFAIAVVYAARAINLRFFEGTPSVAAETAMHAARRNARLIALVYAWGGLAMLAVYKVSGLRWQHGWQYGTGMALIAAGLLFYVHRLGAPHTRLRTPQMLDVSAMLALLQAIAASIALVVMVASGKFQTVKSDWAANHIFVAGGLAIVAVSLIAHATHKRLRRMGG